MRTTVLLSLPLLVWSAAASAADTLNIKEGLWENTITMKMSGMPQMPQMPPEAMARMTPQQRAMMEQSMQTMSGQPRTHRNCVTKKDINEAFENPDTKSQCQRTIVNATSKVLDMTMTCGGRMNMTGKTHIEAPSSDTVHGTTEMSGANNMDMHMTIEGKWISADCAGADGMGK